MSGGNTEAPEDELTFDMEVPEGELMIEEGEEEAAETAAPASVAAPATTSTTTTSATTVSAPATTSSVSSCYPSLSGKKDQKFSGIVLSWTKCTNEDDFQFYKVVKSQTNATPSYPSDSVVISSANPGTTSGLDKTVARAMTYYYRVCVVQRLNKITCGNAISVSY